MKEPLVKDQDKFVLRLPDGMRERIKAAADRNNRSMNAEIVATLEGVYPAPHADAFSDLELIHLQWHAGEWKTLDYDSWMRFRGGEAPAHIIQRMTDRNNYFVVAVIDKEAGLCNLISNNFKLVNSRVESVADDYLTAEERQEYARIWVNRSPTAEDELRIQFLQEKMRPAFKLPPDAVTKLRTRLQGIADLDVIDKLLPRVS